MHGNRLNLVSWIAGTLLAGSFAFAAESEGEWPGWRGPNRDGKSTDKGLLSQWPETGPKLLWKVEDIGSGYSSVATSKSVVYITGNVQGKLTIFAFDSNGKLKWKTIADSAARRGPKASRATTTIDSGNLYLMSGNGVVGCFDTKTGTKKWSQDVNQFGGKSGGWGYTESVLIYKNLAVVKPGGQNGIVALDKNTGKTVWKSTGFKAGPEYSSCIAFTFEGKELICTGTKSGLVCVDANDGKLIWSNKFSAGNTANCPTPVYADGYVFWSNGYGRGGICMKLKKQNNVVTADEVWKSKDMENHHGGFIIEKGYIYGNHKGGWACLDLKTGKKMWDEKAVGKGSICYADGMLYLFSESKGRAGLATLSPKGLELKGKMEVKGSGRSWAHPVVAGGRLYLRYDKNLYCFDVRQK